MIINNKIFDFNLVFESKTFGQIFNSSYNAISNKTQFGDYPLGFLQAELLEDNKFILSNSSFISIYEFDGNNIQKIVNISLSFSHTSYPYLDDSGHVSATWINQIVSLSKNEFIVVFYNIAQHQT